MFTGIVEEIGKITSAQPKSLVIAADETLKGAEQGGSVAVNGVCLTITSISGNSFSVDIMPETLMRTNLGLLSTGDEVNLERPVTLEKQLGGHLVQGHVDDMGRVVSVTRDGEAPLIRVEPPPKTMRYVVDKGFIAIDGLSLTIVDCDTSSFLVSIVEYTREHTTLGNIRVGDLVNLEVDIIAKYIERLGRAQAPGITVGFLQEHGFLVD